VWHGFDAVPDCTPLYWILGNRFSSVSLDYIQQHLTRQELHGSFGRQSHTQTSSQVKLLNTRADDSYWLSNFDADSQPVVQYFPSLDYLLCVLKELSERLLLVVLSS